MKAKCPSQAKPLILFDVTPVTYRREGWGGDSQWGHIFAQPARTPANTAGRAADSQDNRQDGSHYIITRPENTLLRGLGQKQSPSTVLDWLPLQYKAF